MSDLGEITPCYTMTFHRTSKHPPSKLWRCITDAEQVTRWWGGLPATVDLRVGGAYFVQFEEGAGELDGVIVRLEPERTLAYVWGMSTVEWRIEPADCGSRYTFVHHGQLPGLVPNEGGIAAGYHASFDAIERQLDGLPYDGASDEATWRSLEPSYRERIRDVLRSA